MNDSHQSGAESLPKGNDVIEELRPNFRGNKTNTLEVEFHFLRFLNMDLNNRNLYPAVNRLPFTLFDPTPNYVFVEFIGTQDQAVAFEDNKIRPDLPPWFDDITKSYLTGAPHCPMYRWHSEFDQAEWWFRSLVKELETCGDDDFRFYSTFSKLQYAYFDYLRVSNALDTNLAFHSVMHTLLVQKLDVPFRQALFAANKTTTQRLGLL